MNTQTNRQLRFAMVRQMQATELQQALLGLHDALHELECADMFPELTVDYRRLACQLRSLTGTAADVLTTQLTPQPEVA